MKKYLGLWHVIVAGIILSACAGNQETVRPPSLGKLDVSTSNLQQIWDGIFPIVRGATVLSSSDCPPGSSMCTAELEVDAPKGDVFNFYKRLGLEKGWNFDTEIRADGEKSSLKNPKLWGLMNFTSKSGEFKSLTLLIPSDQHTGTNKTRLSVNLGNPPDRITFGAPPIQATPAIKIEESAQNDKWKIRIEYVKYEGKRVELKETYRIEPTIFGDAAAGFHLVRVRVHLERLNGEKIGDEFLKTPPTVQASNGKTYGPCGARVPNGGFYSYERGGIQNILVPVTAKSEADYVYHIPASAKAETFIWPGIQPVSLAARKPIPPTTPEAQKLAGQAAEFLGKGMYTEAIQEAGKALIIDPNNLRALEMRAEAYRMTSQYDAAITDATRLLSFQPDRAYTLRTRAEAHRLKRNYKEAIADADHALKIQPDNAFALQTRAAALWGMKKYDEAIRDATRGIEIAPKNTFALRYRADSYRMKSRYEEAIRDADAVLAINPNDAFMLRTRAEAYRKTGKYDLAIQDAKKALVVEPGNEFAKIVLADAEKGLASSTVQTSGADESDWEEAVKVNTIAGYEEFLQKHPQSPLAEKARGKIVDLEVATILGRSPGQIPSPKKVSEAGNRAFSVVNIHNNTAYNLTIRYSGPDSFKVTFSPHEKGSIEVLRGSFKVAASVDAPNVREYAGDGKSDGGNYEVEYYIVTTNAFGFSPPRIPRISYGPAPKFEPWPKKRAVPNVPK